MSAESCKQPAVRLDLISATASNCNQVIATLPQIVRSSCGVKGRHGAGRVGYRWAWQEPVASAQPPRRSAAWKLLQLCRRTRSHAAILGTEFGWLAHF